MSIKIMESRMRKYIKIKGGILLFGALLACSFGLMRGMIISEKHYYLIALILNCIISMAIVYKFGIRYIIYIPVSIFIFFQIELCNFNSFELINDYYAFVN